MLSIIAFVMSVSRPFGDDAGARAATERCAGPMAGIPMNVSAMSAKTAR
jgi:hypothetical protein